VGAIGVRAYWLIVPSMVKSPSLLTKERLVFLWKYSLVFSANVCVRKGGLVDVRSAKLRMAIVLVSGEIDAPVKL
jgi:hypothetical protein